MKKWIKNQKPENILLVASILYCLLLGILLSYNYQTKDNYNLLFDSDTARVIIDATEVVADHYRADVHPLFMIIVQPVVLFLSGIVMNKMLALILLSAVVSGVSVYYLYKILDSIQHKPTINLILSAIYLFSFSNMIFTSGIETYNFAALFLIMMWYFFLKQENKPMNGYSYVLLILLGILTFGFTITNVCIFLIMVFLLWVMKKITLVNIIKVGVITLGLAILLNIGQSFIWNAPPIWRISGSNEKNFMNNETIGKSNVKEVITNDYYNSLFSNNIHMKISYGNSFNNQNYYITFNDMGIIPFLFVSIFYIMGIFLVVRNFTKKKWLNTGLCLALLFNTLLHIVYGNDSTFLYSLHFEYLMILLFGINLLLEENETFQKGASIFLGVFLLVEFMNNQVIFGKVLNFVKGVLPSNYLLTNLGGVSIILEIGIMLLISFILFLGWNLLKKISKEKKKEIRVLEGIAIVLLFFLVQWIMLEFTTIEDFHKFLWIKIEEKESSFQPKEKIDYLDKDFKKTFQEEIKELEAYNQEIETLKQEYSLVDSKDANWSDYYYFGMGNRRKMVYRPNKLIDIETKEEIVSFEEKEHFIIPNMYTVLVETKENEFIKIIEDETGVHFIKNGKEKIIEGTDVPLNLYSFENQKYQNIKKVLYGEILFNIKDSVIYPNLIVYDKPWYRDAAMVTMVLKQTGNTDLIKDWVSRITDIYDRQNGGVEEADNLGELLYILSSQEERRNDLIREIEEEAYLLAEKNPNGYYIFGKTDFGDQYLYQNLWYKLGMESLGKKYPFKLDTIPEDQYAKMAWWSTYEVKEQTNSEYSAFYPYLSYAERHTLKEGQIAFNFNRYPLSWEIVASSADYSKYQGIDDYMVNARVSPLHSWSASEFLLLLLEETGDLQFA